MASACGAPGTESARSVNSASTRPLRRRLVSLSLLVAAAACYVGIVAVRHGPPPGGDTVPLTSVTSALASGDLRAAASVASLPNPPGYGLLAAPFVAAVPSWFGSPTWCAPAGTDAAPRQSVAHSGNGASAFQCGGEDRLPPWYRSQGVLGLLGWLILAAGGLSLLRASGADSLGRETGLLAFLAFLPAASSAIVQLYHPQDIVSLGLALLGLAQTLRGRWVLAGALFGTAILTKQFAVLALLPALVAAPDGRSRIRLGGTAAAVFVVGLLPFMVSDPRATLDNLSGFSAGGALAGQTILSLSGVTGTAASAVARDAPVLFAVAVCLWAASRWSPRVRGPVGMVALTLVCLGSRLVFESVIFPYYLLATSVLFFLLDLVAERSPYRSLAWCAAAAFFVAVHPANHVVEAVGTLILALAAVGAGFLEVNGTHLAQREHSVA